MLLNFILLISGFALLIKGADYLVDGASSIARRFGISTLIIGLTVVAFGTSAPELAVNVLSAISGNPDIGLGNVNGSNIANILLVLGLTALFIRVPVKSQTVVKEIPFMLLAGVVLVIIMLDVFLDGGSVNVISRIDGLLLLGFFGIFIYYLLLTARSTGAAKKEISKLPLWKASGMAMMGMFGLGLGGQLTVQGASGVALGFGLSQSLIALTFVAVGTSLPELVTAVVAARKGETDIAVGNIVGSNIFNILLVLGATAVIAPVAVSDASIWDATTALAAMIVLFIVVQLGDGMKKDISKDVSKKEGIVMLALYAAYIVYIFIRG